ncbi:class I tRNA ligase family protein [Cerasibacillus sp. JNUCC 74]
MRVQNIDPMQLVETYGADALRWALLADSAPWNNKRFSANLVAQAKSKLIDTWQNVYAFYALYAKIDQFDPQQHSKGKQTLLDKWILSRQQTVVNQVNRYLDEYEFTLAAKVLAEFVDQVSIGIFAVLVTGFGVKGWKISNCPLTLH